MSGGTARAVIIADPKDAGGEVRIVINGSTYMVRGALKRGLREAVELEESKKRNEVKMRAVRTCLG